MLTIPVQVHHFRDLLAKDPELGRKLCGDADHFLQLQFRVMVGYQNLICRSPSPGMKDAESVSDGIPGP